MSDAGKAVFLSYASQDAEAVGQIAAALCIYYFVSLASAPLWLPL